MVDPDRAGEMEAIVERYGEVQTRFQELDGYALEARAREVLAGLSFSQERMDGDVGLLSGGWKMRVALARILLMRPDGMLLDEPISALDIAHQLEILSLLRRLVEDRGISAVVVLHDINLAARFCHHIVALHSGRMIVRGKPEEIMRPGILKDIYGVEMEVMRHPDLSFPISVSK